MRIRDTRAMTDTSHASHTSHTETAVTLTEVDTDGALRDAIDRLPTRARFLRDAAVAALTTTVATGALLPATAQAHQHAAKHTDANGDIEILNFALTLEYLQAAFYTQAERIGELHGPLAEQAAWWLTRARAVKAFQTTLGSKAVKSPHFDFHGTTGGPKAFRATAVAFEDLAVGERRLPSIHSDRVPRRCGRRSTRLGAEAQPGEAVRRGRARAAYASTMRCRTPRAVHLGTSTNFVTLHLPHTSAKRAPPLVRRAMGPVRPRRRNATTRTRAPQPGRGIAKDPGTPKDPGARTRARARPRARARGACCARER